MTYSTLNGRNASDTSAMHSTKIRPDLTLGKRTVHRKLAAMVVRKLIVKNGVHQSRKGKRQQECQSIDATLSYDRKQ